MRSLLALTLAISISGWPAPAGADTALELADCLIEDAAAIRRAAARCGRLPVPEDRAALDGRQIELFVAIVPALDPDADAAPLVILAGGPGQAASEFYVGLQPAFRYLERRRDIVLIDQRGTGRSNPLQCEADVELGLDHLDSGLAEEEIRGCLETLNGDPRHYTTSVAVHDLEDVRRALRIEELNIYGASYGTRVALHYLRRFPDRVRTLILDGVVPADRLIGPDLSTDAQHALDRLFERCAENPECGRTFPDLSARFDAVLDRLRLAPIEVRLAHPFSGEPVNHTVTATGFAGVVRMLSYSTATASLLPLLIREASEGYFEPLAAQALLVSETLTRQLSIGMHYAVVCTEDVPFYQQTTGRQPIDPPTYLGTAPLQALIDTCRYWPSGVIDEDFRQPLEASIPALLLSGEADPVTPPRNAEQAAVGLTRALNLVLDGQAHGQAALGCIPRLMAEFVARGASDELDTQCIELIRPIPFFLHFTGPGA